jgi:hypothetical protein
MNDLVVFLRLFCIVDVCDAEGDFGDVRDAKNERYWITWGECGTVFFTTSRTEYLQINFAPFPLYI